jgi:collagenase-like PrtC family protease
MKLSLGPILYYWERERVLDFYAEVADWPVDIVTLGETVCSKRRALRLEDWLTIADRLHATGKEVVLTTLALVEAESELSMMRRIVSNDQFAVEANDAAALGMLASRPGAAFVAGPSLNVYNGETLAVLGGLGARRWVLPVELSQEMLAALHARRPAGMETEVLVFGRLPLALSARCFTARAHDLPKDMCGFRCRDYPDGLPLATREGKRFLTLNGIQTQSGSSSNLARAVPLMQQMGIEVARLSPQSTGMKTVVQGFRDLLDGRLSAAEAERVVTACLDGEACNGYWYGQPGMIAQPAM